MICNFINGAVSSSVTSTTLTIKSRTYLPTTTNPIPWYIEDPISVYTSYFIVPSGGTTLPSSCSLVLASDGTTAYTSTSYVFSGSTITFVSYASYW